MHKILIETARVSILKKPFEKVKPHHFQAITRFCEYFWITCRGEGVEERNHLFNRHMRNPSWRFFNIGIAMTATEFRVRHKRRRHSEGPLKKNSGPVANFSSRNPPGSSRQVADRDSYVRGQGILIWRDSFVSDH